MDLSELELDISSITKDQIMILKAQYKMGVEHLKYFEDTMKHFKYPERRMKTHDTVQFERTVPQIKKILEKLKIRV